MALSTMDGTAVTLLDSPVLDPAFSHELMAQLRDFGPIPLKHIIRRDSTALDNYFSAEISLGHETRLPSADELWTHPTLCDAARNLYGRPVLAPRSTSVHLMTQADTGGPHTDAPHFRGCRDIGRFPASLRILMHHSGAFAELRAPVATAVLWLQDPTEQGFRIWVDGPDEPSMQLSAASGSGVLFDADSTLHGIDRPLVTNRPRWPVLPGIDLHANTNGWEARLGHRSLGQFAEADMRISMVWKAYCFDTEQDRDDYFAAPLLDRLYVQDRLVEVARQRADLPKELSPWPDIIPLLEQAILPTPTTNRSTIEEEKPQ